MHDFQHLYNTYYMLDARVAVKNKRENDVAQIFFSYCKKICFQTIHSD